MTLHAASPPQQLTIDFEPGLAERFPSLLDCLRACIYGSRRGLKAVASDMDMSASELGRKLKGGDDDPRRFSVEDLEAYMRATHDTTPVQWLAARYLPTDDQRRQHALATATRLLEDLGPLLQQLKGAA